jgi:hypothetical protein
MALPVHALGRQPAGRRGIGRLPTVNEGLANAFSRYVGYSLAATDSNCSVAHNDELIQLIGVTLEYILESLHSQIKERRRETKIDDARVLQVLVENQFSKVPIIRNEHPILSLGDGEDVYVGEANSIVACEGRVVTECYQDWNEPSVSAVVDEESHASVFSPAGLAERASRPRSRCTSSCAYERHA